MRKKFLPREHKKRKLLKPRWRKPKGHHSKMRRKERTQAMMPGVGLKKPEAQRGLHPSGFLPVVISHENEMSSLDKKKNAIYLSGKLGMKKKVALTKVAEKHGIKVLNPKKETKKEKKTEDKKEKKDKKKPETKESDESKEGDEA
jgi:large subunit ribosomal protein L32e